MANEEVLLSLSASFFIHLLFVIEAPNNAAINNSYPVVSMITLNSVFRVSLLLFPLFGLLADVYLTRH